METTAHKWDLYCALRDRLVRKHVECLAAKKRTPRDVWMFVTSPKCEWRTYKLPEYKQRKRLNDWLDKAVEHCNSILNEK